MPRRQSIIEDRVIVALSLWAVVGSISLVLTGRAIAGAFDEPVSAAIPVLATLFILCGSLSAWRVFHRDGRRGDVGRRLLDGLLSLVPAGLAGFAAAANAGPTTLAATAGLVVCGLIYVVAREATRPVGSTTVRSIPGANEGPQESSAPSRRRQEFSVVDTEVADEDVPPAPELPVSQQISRKRLPDGSEQIEAVLLASFAPGQRRVALHLPIQPVMRSQPEVECEPLDEAAVAVLPTFVAGYGIRLDVKRSEELDEAMDVAIGVLATATAEAESAA